MFNGVHKEDIIRFISVSEFNNGIIFQWGAAGDTDLATLPITFTEQLYQVTASLAGDRAYAVSMDPQSWQSLSSIFVHRAVRWGWHYVAVGV